MKKLTLFLTSLFVSIAMFAQTQMSGEYTVGTGGTYDYASLADAGMAIKSAEFTGDVTLLICTDLTETINTGIVNKSNFTLTIRPDKDENRTITYTTATDNIGPTGVFVIGGDMTKTPGSTIGWASIPTKNVVVDGAAEGKTTPRLKITNNKWGTNVLLYGDVQDVIIRNCILVGRSGSSTAYSLTFRSEKYSKTSKNIGPKNCVAENCIIESASTQSQVVYCQGNEANSYAGYPTNITIRNCSITSHLRGMFLYGVNGMNIEGCTFNMLETSAGYMCHGILGTTVKGKINVKGNKFIKNTTKNTSAGEYGLQTITASGGATVWVIENNYFAGYNAVASGTTTKESRLVGIRCGDPCEIRHNTFYMPKLTYAPATPLVSTHAVALLWLAGSHKYPVQNNIFVCEETTANVSLIRGGLNENVTGNVFYHKGGNAAIVAAAPSCMAFADLETSYPAQAATSKWVNVEFTDAAAGDLSLAGSSIGNSDLAVNRLAEVLTDITGKERAETTYAGAYESVSFDAVTYTVSAVANEAAMGEVTGTGTFEKGEEVTLTATPNRGYRFVNWTVGEDTHTENPLTLTVNSDLTVIANFAAIPQYTITATVNNESMGAVEGAGVYYEGETVTLTAKPNAGHAFVDWSNGATTPTLTFVAEKDTTVTANFNILSYTLTVNVNDETRGSVDFTTGTYEYGTEVKVTATPEDGYEFAGWSNGSKANPLTITVKKDETITANFRAILASSITLNALPVQDYSASIVGTVKRAIQNGENTIVLTHEANGTPHIYNVAHATNTVTEISQEGVVAVDPENAGDLLAISDIALTEDGKLLAINKIVCQASGDQVDAGYKRGETRVYIWNDLASVPTIWFESKQSSNWYRSIQGHTMAYKGTSTNGTLFTTGVTATGVKFRYSVYNVIDGIYTDPNTNDSEYYHFTKGDAQTTDLLGANYELNVSPLAENAWVLDGNLTNPFEITDPLTYNTEVTAGATINNDLGKKYNGASYLANYNEHHLMVAPYVAEDKLTGVKVLGITDGFATATVVETNTALETAVEATAAAATAYVDGDGDLTIHLFADAKVYTFTQEEQGPATAVDNTTVTPQVQKIIRNGQVLIIRDDKTYNMMGQEVK